MDFNKNEREKIDEKAKSKIPPVSKSTSQLKPLSSRTTKNTPQPVVSKIPKPGTGLFAKRVPLSSRPSRIEPLDTKKSSKSCMSLIHAKTARQDLLASTKSRANTPRLKIPERSSEDILRSPEKPSTQRSVKSRIQTPRSLASEPSCERFQKPSERAATRKNLIAFEVTKGKMLLCQSEFMKKWDAVKDDLPPDEGEYKLIAVGKDNGMRLVTNTAPKVRTRYGLEEFRKSLNDYGHNINKGLDLLDQWKSTPGKIGDSTLQDLENLNYIEDVKMKIKLENQIALENLMRQVDSFETVEKTGDIGGAGDMNCDLEVKVQNLVKEIDEYRKSLDQNQKELTKIKKSSEDKAMAYKRELDEKDKAFLKKQQEFDELRKKLDGMEKECHKYRTAQKDMLDKLNNKMAEIEELKKQMKAQTSVIEQNKKKEYEATIKQLEADLKAAQKYNESHTGNIDQALKYAPEIKALKAELLTAKKDKENLEKEVQQLKKEIQKKVETESLHSAESETLRQTIKEMKTKVAANESQSNISRDFNEELNKLKKSDGEKTQMIEDLQMELKKAKFQVSKLEEKVLMDRKLLELRRNLIESLQTKETTLKVRFEDLFAEVGEKKNEVQMLKSDLLLKTEEFQNLFSTLSAKQMELTRQEHIIKLLKESNERAQTVRVRQEAKIGQLEEEVAQLKQTLSLYQDAVIPNNMLRKNLLMIEANRDTDYNQGLEYYTDERRRKRHIDISVKKYEK